MAALRAFEATYRDNISTFLKSQLHEVERTRLAPSHA